MEMFCDKCHTSLELIKEGRKITGLKCCKCRRKWSISICEDISCPDLS